nr:MAG TPA: hypothetical protein [Siphoviridae sp. ctQHO9]
MLILYIPQPPDTCDDEDQLSITFLTLKLFTSFKLPFK